MNLFKKSHKHLTNDTKIDIFPCLVILKTMALFKTIYVMEAWVLKSDDLSHSCPCRYVWCVFTGYRSHQVCHNYGASPLLPFSMVSLGGDIVEQHLYNLQHLASLEVPWSQDWTAVGKSCSWLVGRHNELLDTFNILWNNCGEWPLHCYILSAIYHAFYINVHTLIESTC